MTAMKKHILIVEDDKAIVAFVQPALEQAGFAVQRARDGETALAQIRRQRPDLILLDLGLPGMDGLEVCRQVRQSEPYIPIIMLTARKEEIDRVVGLEIGADDYVTKPFYPRELVARVRAVLRRELVDAGQAGPRPRRDQVQVGELVIDRDGRTVTRAGQRIALTPKEFDLLAALARERGRGFGREMLLERVWGYDYMGESRTVDVHVQRLRHKIEPDPARPRYLLTVRGIGYKFADEEEL